MVWSSADFAAGVFNGCLCEVRREVFNGTHRRFTEPSQMKPIIWEHRLDFPKKLTHWQMPPNEHYTGSTVSRSSATLPRGSMTRPARVARTLRSLVKEPEENHSSSFVRSTTTDSRTA